MTRRNHPFPEQLQAAGATEGAFREQLSNGELVVQKFLRGGLGGREEREVVQAKGAPWTQPGGREAMLSVRRPACPKSWRILAGVLLECGPDWGGMEGDAGSGV